MHDRRAPYARRVIHRVLDVLWPPRCVSCRVLDTWLCPACLGRMEGEPLTVCVRCLSPLDGVLSCPVCRLRPGSLVTLTTVGVYGGVLKDAIFALKYHHRQAIAPSLASLLLPVVLPLLRPGDVMIPVPLHPARLRQRGYNQAAVLAHALSDALALDGPIRVEVREDLVRRVRSTADQTRLGPLQRQVNMTGAFSAVAAPHASTASDRLWLIDDVLTTGATLRACATALIAADVSVQVHGLALARAPGLPLRVPRAKP